MAQKVESARFEIGQQVDLQDGRSGRIVGCEFVERDPRRGKQGWRYLVRVPEVSGFVTVHESELRAIPAPAPIALPISDDDLYGVLR